MITSLKRFYFDDYKLKERTLLELVRAFGTGRMIAFVGSMATESLGYGDWDTLIEDYVGEADKLAAKKAGKHARYISARRAVEAIHGGRPKAELLEKRVSLSLVKEALAVMDEVAPLESGSRVNALEEFAATKFADRRGGPSLPATSPVRPLIADLAIRRIATLNYDLELEAAMMVEPGDIPDARGPAPQLEYLLRKGVIQCDRYRLRRLLGNGLTVESDVSDRERPDRLIEFAVGSADVDHRIMHLHGRALKNEAKTMIVSLRDYDRLYRKDDIAKLPFEHGQRILFAGNPVLFIGAGMSEPELNETLRDFVSNNPHRRFAPTFLLWNTAGFSDKPEKRATQIWLKRIDFLQRLGVLTIFDEDLAPPDDLDLEYDGPDDPQAIEELQTALATYAEKTAELKTKIGVVRNAKKEVKELDAGDAPGRALAKARARKLELELLAESIPQIARAGMMRDLQLNNWKGPWRNLSARFAQSDRTKPIALWGTGLELAFDPNPDLKKLFDKERPCRHRVVVAKAGSGKGALAWKIANAKRIPNAFDAPVGNRLIINAGFAFDTDFLLLAISRFLLKLQGQDWKAAPPTSRERQFERSETFQLAEKALIIVNGMERFFTMEGAPLSAELDHLLRRIAMMDGGDVRWLFLGTPRILPYFRNISESAVTRFEDCCTPKGPVGRVDSVFFSELVRRFEKPATDPVADRSPVADPGPELIMKAAARGDPRQIRRTVLGTYLNAAALQRSGIADPGLALEVLRAMAFIGSPIEATVLLHVPRIRDRLEGCTETAVQRLVETLAALKERALVMAITPFEDYPCSSKGLWERFGLHTAVSSELRHQFGVPVSESKLSTSFNMSLYIAQPVDGFIPEEAIHEELGKLIDHLIGAYKDDLHPEEGAVACDPDCGIVDGRSCAPAATAALRAALSVVRSYYSTTSLLTLDRGARLASDDRDGVLLEHAERLETLLRVYRKLRRARHRASATLSASCGPEPFYPDDLVWIHNELGVVYLAQGDLYSARRSFELALKVNRSDVEYRDPSHNWRRITMNQVLLDIERARLADAERKLEYLEESINARSVASRSKECRRFRFIRGHFGEGAPADRSCFDPDIMHEELLMTGLVLGHRGLCHHIRGHLRTAQPLYQDAIAILRRLGEHRAYAFFQRHFAQLQTLLEPENSTRVAIKLAVTAAEAVRQMDIAHHARIVDANATWNRHGADSHDRRRALRQLTDASSYGALMDLHRLRIEAGIALARLKFESGDYETALDHATEAMALAARYGHSLRKISIRLDMGQILIRRGDPKSGAALLARAVEAADRFGYQRAVEAAQRIRVEEGVAA